MPDILGIIKSRRSIRKYLDKPIPVREIKRILESGRWAPSGQNNQPWKFRVINDKPGLKRLSNLTRHSRIISSSTACIAVFLDNHLAYNRIKDCQSVGACIQNMLLYSHSMGIGSCWLGQILENSAKVNKLFGLPVRYELMAVVSLGYPDETARSNRKPLKDLLLN
ncbi:MAG: nitroreductase [Planctomycetota bacterium]